MSKAARIIPAYAGTPGRCIGCGRDIAKGDDVWYDETRRVAYCCLRCVMAATKAVVQDWQPSLWADGPLP